MSLNRYAAKRDLNEKAIVQALQAAGAKVWKISGKGCPDLLVWFGGSWMPVEVKSATGRLTKAQAAPLWPVVRDVESMLTALGLKDLGGPGIMLT